MRATDGCDGRDDRSAQRARRGQPLYGAGAAGRLPRRTWARICRISRASRCCSCAAADTWHAYAVPALEAWGLKVQAYRHPAQLDLETLEEADTLIVCGEHDTWHADDVSRLLGASSWMIDCSAEGPAYPVVMGREVKVSSYGLKGLAAALRHTLQGDASGGGQRDTAGIVAPAEGAGGGRQRGEPGTVQGAVEDARAVSRRWRKTGCRRWNVSHGSASMCW